MKEGQEAAVHLYVHVAGVGPATATGAVAPAIDSELEKRVMLLEATVKGLAERVRGGELELAGIAAQQGLIYRHLERVDGLRKRGRRRRHEPVPMEISRAG